MTPWFAAVADANGVIFESDAQLVRRDGCLSDSEVTDEQINKASDAAAFHDSSLHMVPSKIDASDARLAGRRKVICAGSVWRTPCLFFAQAPHAFSVPRAENHCNGSRRSRKTDE